MMGSVMRDQYSSLYTIDGKIPKDSFFHIQRLSRFCSTSQGEGLFTQQKVKSGGKRWKFQRRIQAFALYGGRTEPHETAQNTAAW